MERELARQRSDIKERQKDTAAKKAALKFRELGHDATAKFNAEIAQQLSHVAAEEAKDSDSGGGEGGGPEGEGAAAPRLSVKLSAEHVAQAKGQVLDEHKRARAALDDEHAAMTRKLRALEGRAAARLGAWWRGCWLRRILLRVRRRAKLAAEAKFMTFRKCQIQAEIAKKAMESSLSLDEALLVELTCMECYSRVEAPVAVPHAAHEEEGISLYCRKCVDNVKRRRRQERLEAGETLSSARSGVAHSRMLTAPHHAIADLIGRWEEKIEGWAACMEQLEELLQRADTDLHDLAAEKREVHAATSPKGAGNVGSRAPVL